VALGVEDRLGRAATATDMERQLNLGAYVLGDDRPQKLLLDGLPHDHVMAYGGAEEPDRLAFGLPGSTACC